MRSVTYDNPTFITGLNKITGDQEETFKLQDINFEYTIEDGTLIIEPFDFKLVGREATVYGSSGISSVQSKMNYFLETEIKTGDLGVAANNMIASLTGLKDLAAEEVRMNIKIEGNYEDPQFRLDGISNVKKGSSEKKIKGFAKEQAKIKLKEQQELAGEKIKEQLDKQKSILIEEVDKYDFFLEKNNIDIAVHALKDMPAIETNGLLTDTFLERTDAREVIIINGSKKFKYLKKNAVIGTSSYRRQFQIKKIRPDVNCKLIRGNVDTRIKKLMDGEYDAIILSYAGIKYLKLEDKISEIFSIEEIIPSAGQGIIALQCRENDDETISILSKINHDETCLLYTSDAADE